ncbi:HAD domain-containing protein [Clostridium sp. C2-6-12]|uniref:HAD domain-containing protein n=1 Tax=Clostridium sp. C2-6-12 TaxID=2698832 RepID=UPI00136D454E|nr:HAD domain-containing protein [Clostridium sp. C2-6-12]
MKVIFLDIDGVINSNFWMESHQKEISDGTLIDKEKIELLAKIVHKTGAALVMHSGWRFWFNNDMQPIRKEAQNLIDLLLDSGLSIYAMTPDLTTEEIRKSKMFSKVKASEIFLWLKQNPNIDKWIVLDDIDLHNDELAIRQIRTNPEIGITEKDADKAIEMLL